MKNIRRNSIKNSALRAKFDLMSGAVWAWHSRATTEHVAPI
jgi:hypothetical protein